MHGWNLLHKEGIYTFELLGRLGQAFESILKQEKIFVAHCIWLFDRSSGIYSLNFQRITAKL